MSTPTIARPPDPPPLRLLSLRDALTRALDLVDAELADHASPSADASPEPVPSVGEYLAAIRGAR